MVEELDLNKLKVHELRAELEKRGLRSTGLRQALISRLTEHLNNEKGANPVETLRSAPEPAVPTSQAANESVLGPSAAVETFSKNLTNGVNEPSKDEVNCDETNKEIDNAKRKRSRSPRRRSRSRDARRSPRRRSHSRSPLNKSRYCDEPNAWEKRTDVFLDGYNCDLNLLIDSRGYEARPLISGGFSMMWAGVRANFGVIEGKAFFEVRVLKNMPVENIDSLVGGATHVLRVGWSTERTDFALGEEEHSYGYGGTAKKSCNNKFVNYGCPFGEGDVVGAFLEWTNNEAILRFSVNGADQGECYRVQRLELGDYRSLFPHIYVKNVEFTVNFGQDNQQPWFPPCVPGDNPSSWRLVNHLPLSSRVHGRLPPASKAECEVLMMIGLPGCGKTCYADRLRNDCREKQYNVLGTNLVLDKMKVMGLARQRNYAGRWDVLIDKATKCLNSLINVACLRRRNYILDQTNVYPSAQRRKMRPFEGFKRKAIVIIPTDEEFRRRIAQREKEEGKEVPESAVLEMKANFGIPKSVLEDPTSVFDEVNFIELNMEESQLLVQQYNQEGQTSRPPPQKKQRWDGNNRDRDRSRDSRFPGRDRGRDPGRGRRDDFRRSPNRRGDRGPREYRGGYSEFREKGRSDGRFDRNRDRDYGRQAGGRFGGPGGPGGPGARFGGPPNRGGFPGPVGYGGFDGPRGGMALGGYGRSGFDAPRGNFRGSMERGFGPPSDSMFGGPYDSPSGKGNPGKPPFGMGNDMPDQPMSSGPMGGYRGGYNASNTGRGMNPAQYPRGNLSGQGESVSRGGGPGRDAMTRGMNPGRGGVSGRGASRGGPQGDRDTNAMFSDDAQQSLYNTYSGSEGFQTDEAYSGMGNEYRGRSRDRFSGSYGPGPGSKTMPNEFANSYQRNNAPYGHGYSVSDQNNYPGGASAPYMNANSTYPGYNNANSFPGSDSYAMGSEPTAQSTRTSSRFGPADEKSIPTDHGGNENTSLYASGAARFSDSRSAASQPRQSRFDSVSPSNQNNPQQSFNKYPTSNYANPTGTQKTGSAAGGPRSGRSRFDAGPPVTQPASAPPSQMTNPQSTVVQSVSHTQASAVPGSQPSVSVPQPSAYGYGYGAKVDGSMNQITQPTTQASYGSYNYGYGYGSYGNQPAQATTPAPRPPAPGATATQSLYASAVADKSQVTPGSVPTSTVTSTNPTNVAAAAAYASYYYGAPPGAAAIPTAGKYDAAMVAAQQFNAWQQQQQQPAATAGSNAASKTPTPATAAPAAAVPTTAAYPSYYPGYAAYPAAYGGVPVAGAPPSAATPATPLMPQYYAGYR